MSHFLNKKVVDGNSACKEDTTVCAAAADMSKMPILVDCAAKKRTIASPIPDAPPESVSYASLQTSGCEGTKPVTMTLFPIRIEFAIYAL